MTRDDDPHLYCHVVKILWLEWQSVYDTLTSLSYQTVRATRQNLQMLNPDLRWKTYEERKCLWAKKRKYYSQTHWDRLVKWWNK